MHLQNGKLTSSTAKYKDRHSGSVFWMMLVIWDE